MADGLTLRIITPERIVLDTTVSSVKVPGVDGLIGILPRHAPMVTALDSGTLAYDDGGKSHEIFVSGGFAEVRNNTVRVVSEAGERPEDIDEERAKKAEARARERLENGRKIGAAQYDLLRAELSLRRARQRLRLRSR